MLAALLACTLVPAIALAQGESVAESNDTDTQRVVKVGYMPQEGVLTRNEDGTYEGYTYEYLDRIAQFTGWKYEFVEAPGADEDERATNLIDMLLNGEVDIEGSMTYSTSLAELFEYPSNSYGTAHTSLFVPDANASITSTDLFTQGELRVALPKTAKMRREELVYFCEKNDINLVTVECESLEEVYDKTLSGEADAFLDIDVNVRDGFHIVSSFTGRPYFFAAPKGHRDIVDEIDETIGRINESNPTLQTTLYDKYFMQTDSNFDLSEDELAFAKQHEKLRVGVIAERAPLQSFDRQTGKLQGVSTGVLDYLAEHAGFSFEIVRINRTDNLYQALRDADVDIVAGINNADTVSATLGLSMTASYLSASKLLVYNKYVNPDDLSDKTVAVSWDLVGTVPKDSKVAVYDSMEECFAAVNDGRADYLYGTSYITPYYMSADNLSNLLTLPISDKSIEMCFGLVQPTEPDLLSIFNKSIRNLSGSDLDSIVYESSLINEEDRISLFVSDHLIEIALAAISLLVVIITLLAALLRTRARSAKRAREENLKFQEIYRLANEQFFEYSIANDILRISKPKNPSMGFIAPGAAEDEQDGDSSYLIVRDARKRILASANPELVDAFTAPTGHVTDVLCAVDDGSRQWIRVTSHFVTDEMGKPISVIGKITDVNDEMREKMDLSDRAHHDGLTGLLNWKTFQEKAAELLSRNGAGALLIIDTDDFKHVNDTYGHQAGDGALRCTAAALKKAFRTQDLIGRLGGDEFAVCIDGPVDCASLAQRCESIVEKGVDFLDQNGETRTVTLSVGCVDLSSVSRPVYETAYQRADKALYRAKAEGKDRYVIESYLD